LEALGQRYVSRISSTGRQRDTLTAVFDSATVTGYPEELPS
jgi:hypothetical protein